MQLKSVLLIVASVSAAVALPSGFTRDEGFLVSRTVVDGVTREIHIPDWRRGTVGGNSGNPDWRRGTVGGNSGNPDW
ncbi:hypothetical protein BV22DRAFT_1132217 [Leucogyrophana mollusca]|uniref:Uncharacterized protein n=1 Tax=Leucogyrophana mollusca TaxID=85980 RepID=A0ACB8B6S7_9AGAM|nr:hypothetical protein BV22DRAFT_1132217 [Leucogyrophana mollusca]